MLPRCPPKHGDIGVPEPAEQGERMSSQRIPETTYAGRETEAQPTSSQAESTPSPSSQEDAQFSGASQPPLGCTLGCGAARWVLGWAGCTPEPPSPAALQTAVSTPAQPRGRLRGKPQK